MLLHHTVLARIQDYSKDAHRVIQNESSRVTYDPATGGYIVSLHGEDYFIPASVMEDVAA